MPPTDTLIPNRAMFDFCLTVPRLARPPRLDGRLTGWPEANRLLDLGGVDGIPPTAAISLGWDEAGLYVAARVRGKSQPPQCDRASYWTTDGLRLWIDTRDTRDIHRASRYCHQFVLFPDDFSARQIAIPRAKEDAPLCEPSALTVAGRHTPDGYDIEAAVPASVLQGYDPREHPRLGFCYYLRDREITDQYLTVGGVFPYYQDPSLWATIVLVDAPPDA